MSALASLRACWPGREAEIDQLWSLLEEPDLALLLYVYGPSGGGKSGVVRGVLDALGTRYAILDCVTYCTPRSLFEAALSQFNRHVPRAANSYVGWSDCDSPAAFVAGLQEVIGEYGRAVLVLENALELEKRRELRTLLLSLQTLCHSAAVSVVFVAEAPWEEAHTACAFASLCSVRFAGYTKAQLERILALDAATVAPELEAAYRDFLPIFVAYFWEICRDLHELRYSCRAAFHQSMQPVRDGLLQLTDKRALLGQAKECLQRMRLRVYVREAAPQRWSESAKTAESLKPNPGTLSLPTSSKWLLVAAYLASRCLPRMDAALFCSRQKAHFSKRAKRARLSNEEQHNFSLQRLLAIYAAVQDGGDPTPSTDLLTQLSSLLHMRLLGRVSRPEELDTVRLACTAALETVQAVAKDLAFELGVYLDE